MDRPEAGTTGSAPLTGTTPAPAPRERRRPNRKQQRLKRIAILAALLFVIVFVLAFAARSCQQNRKVDSYRAYLDGVSSAIDDSAALGKQLGQVVENPTKYSRKELIAKLEELTTKQKEIADRAAGFQPPDTLSAQQAVFAEGMGVRSEGFTLLQAALVASLGNETVSPGKIASLDGYFSGPDAYYMSRFYVQTRNVMSEQGVSDVAVPTATYYLTARTLENNSVEQMLGAVGSSSKLVGLRGVGLAGVSAQPSDVELTQGGKATSVTASADLAFEVRVMNQGDVDESNIVVKADLVLPDGRVLTQSATIAGIAAGKTGAATITGLDVPPEALSKTCTLKITAEPVPSERVKTNNSGTYKILLQLG